MVTHWRDLDPGDPEYVELVLALVVVWGFADTVSSLTAAAFVGPALEANPLVRGLLPRLVPTLAVKFTAVLFVGTLAIVGERFVRSLPWWRGWLAALVGAGVGVSLLNLVVAYSPLLGV